MEKQASRSYVVPRGRISLWCFNQTPLRLSLSYPCARDIELTNIALLAARYIFDLRCTVNVSLSGDQGEAKGAIKLLEVSNDCEDDFEVGNVCIDDVSRDLEWINRRSQSV